MNEAHELAEKIEHAGHGSGHGGHGGGIGRHAGITMALLGVMLALCAALVGGARTELIATMVEQSNTYQKYQAQRMKHRIMITQLATLHALSPSRRELARFNEQLTALSGPDANLKAALGLSTTELVKIIEPRAEDQTRLLNMTKRYGDEQEAAAKWAESYEEAVHAHTLAAEHFEWGQLLAEIGIVVASVALLLSNRKAWYLSVALGAGCVCILAWTYIDTRGHIHHAEDEIAETKAAYQKLRKNGETEKDDEEILSEVEKRIHDMTPVGVTPPTHEGAHEPTHEAAPEHR